MCSVSRWSKASRLLHRWLGPVGLLCVSMYNGDQTSAVCSRMQLNEKNRNY